MIELWPLVDGTVEFPNGHRVRWVRDHYHPKAVETPQQRRWITGLDIA